MARPRKKPLSEEEDGEDRENFPLRIYPGNPQLSSNVIEILQMPVFHQRLGALKEIIDGKVESALALPCTEKTLTDIKTIRAELNRMRADLDGQRKAAKAKAMEPWNEIERLFKANALDPLDSADKKLKEKVDYTTAEIKRPCEEGLREYFSELCEVHHVDFLTFERVCEIAGVKIDMASARQKTPTKLRKQLAEFVVKASDDIEAISEMELADEILMEYQSCLSLSKAIGTVLDRHKRIDAVRADQDERREEREREQEAIAKVEALAPPIEVELETKKLRAAFEVYEPEENLLKLVRFMRENGIDFKQLY